MRCFAFGNVDWLIVTKQQIAGVEKIFALVRSQGKNARIHADSIARASFDTEAAEHTAQFIDDKRDRVFFYRRIGMFAGLNVNA
jgi:glycerol-3-phosphate responsive antiterminator